MKMSDVHKGYRNFATNGRLNVSMSSVRTFSSVKRSGFRSQRGSERSFFMVKWLKWVFADLFLDV